MTGQPDGEQARHRIGAGGSAESREEEGAGLGMGGEDTTFEPEETPEALDDVELRREAAQASGIDGAVEPRELVPDDDRADEQEAPWEVLPDEDRGVDDLTESEADRLLPDPERPVPGGPADPL